MSSHRQDTPVAPAPLVDFTWQGARDRVVLSAAAGGRVVSWRREGAGELVKPVDVVDGGLLRVLFGEERYPGAGHTLPHLAQVERNDRDGFVVRLRSFWNMPNLFARGLDRPEKISPVYLDGLWLDKVVRFDARDATLAVELAITNASGGLRRLSLWLHNHFCAWVHHAFVLTDGVREPYICRDIWWAGHPPSPGKSMRLVHAGKDESLSVVLGSDIQWLAGMASHTREDYGETYTEGCIELRGRTLEIAPGQRLVVSAFLALCEGREAWRRWALDAPIALRFAVEDAEAVGAERDAPWPLLEHWALPGERGRGVMALGALDKIPFAATQRYSAANSFARFHAAAGGATARATATLVAFEQMEVCAALDAPAGWRLAPAARDGTIALARHAPHVIALEGPADLAGKERVTVTLSRKGRHLLDLCVEPDAAVEPAHAFQVKQTSTYLDERWRAERGGFGGASPREFEAWQGETRERLLRWVHDAVLGPCPLQPRLMERQVGPHCVREKVLIQTEAGMWLPMFLILPRNVPAGTRMPAILFPCGSGPGKVHFAPDETPEMQDPARDDVWPVPYQFAHQLGCAVLIPDRRGWGEWSEANHGQRSQRAFHAGYNVIAQDVWDHMRAVEYLAQRADVDASRIVSMGSSGGGWMTMFMLGAGTRVAGGIVSSSVCTLPALPDQYFFRTFVDENAPINPPPQLPLATATILCLAAPRPLWIMDGKWDRGVLPTLPHTEAEAHAAFARWHAETNAGRAEVERAYRIAGAPSRYRADWFEGDHLAGFTLRNIAAWLREHFGVRR